MPSDAGGENAPGGGGETASPSGADEPESQPTADAPDVPAPNPDEYPNRDQRTPEGAEQAVRYYFALVFWGYQTGDSAPIEAMHSADCGSCDGFVEQIRELGQSSEYWEEVTIEDFGIEVFKSPNFEHEIGYIFTLKVRKGGFEGMGPTGKDFLAIAGVDWSGDTWKIGAMSFEEA